MVIGIALHSGRVIKRCVALVQGFDRCGRCNCAAGGAFLEVKDTELVADLRDYLDAAAIVFYFAFLPAFIEPGRATSIDFALILAAMTVAIAAPKLTYAALAADLAERFSSRAVILLRITGVMLRVVGGIILGRGLSLVPVWPAISW